MPLNWKKWLENKAKRTACLPGLSWGRMDQAHLTLAFLGEVPDAQLPDVKNKIGEALTGPAFTGRLGSPGAFPSSSNPRILWINFQDASGRLQENVDRVRARLLELPMGFNFDKPFRAHVTLVRLSKKADRKKRTELFEQFCNLFDNIDDVPEAPFAAIDLMQSELGPTGARHTPIASFPLESV